MIFRELGLAGAWVIDPEPHEDARGAFARLFCAQHFGERGLVTAFDQTSISFNVTAGTVRGLHLQRPPYAETKLVRATAGSAYDVIVDLRAGSPTYGQWEAIALSGTNRRQVYVPHGFAHGFQALEDGTELLYQIATPYAPLAQDGVFWADRDLAIDWPLDGPVIVSERDMALPGLSHFRPIKTDAAA